MLQCMLDYTIIHVCIKCVSNYASLLSPHKCTSNAIIKKNKYDITVNKNNNNNNNNIQYLYSAL